MNILIQNFLESYDLLREFIIQAHGFKSLEITDEELWSIATGMEWELNKEGVLRTVMCSFRYIKYSEYKLCEDGILSI